MRLTLPTLSEKRFFAKAEPEIWSGYKVNVRADRKRAPILDIMWCLVF